MYRPNPYELHPSPEMFPYNLFTYGQSAPACLKQSNTTARNSKLQFANLFHPIISENMQIIKKTDRLLMNYKLILDIYY